MERISRRPCQTYFHHSTTANQALCRRCARPIGRRNRRAPPSTPRECLDTPTTYDVGVVDGRLRARMRARVRRARACRMKPRFGLFTFWPSAKSQIRILVNCLTRRFQAAKLDFQEGDDLPRDLLLP
jgi:hypothetical protein